MLNLPPQAKTQPPAHCAFKRPGRFAGYCSRYGFSIRGYHRNRCDHCPHRDSARTRIVTDNV